MGHLESREIVTYFRELQWFLWYSHLLATCLSNWVPFGDELMDALEVIDQELLLKGNYIQRLSLQ